MLWLACCLSDAGNSLTFSEPPDNSMVGRGELGAVALDIHLTSILEVGIQLKKL